MILTYYARGRWLPVADAMRKIRSQ